MPDKESSGGLAPARACVSARPHGHLDILARALGRLASVEAAKQVPCAVHDDDASAGVHFREARRVLREGVDRPLEFRLAAPQIVEGGRSIVRKEEVSTRKSAL